MGLSHDVYYRSPKRDKDPLTALSDRVRLAHYRFRLTYGLTCQTPGEEVVTHLFCVLLFIGSVWLSYRAFAYCACLVTELMPKLAETPIVQSIVSIASIQAKIAYKALDEAVQTSLHATRGGELRSTAATVARNASVLTAS